MWYLYDCYQVMLGRLWAKCVFIVNCPKAVNVCIVDAG